MAYDDRHSGGRRERGWGGRERGGRSQRLGDRWRGPEDDPYADAERYGGGAPQGYGCDADSDIRYGGPGFDAGFGGPRFDRIDVGSTGTQGVHPISSPTHQAYGFGPSYGSAARQREILRHDPHYAEWRRQQIAALDRDYEEYRRENQSRFDREFGAWRSRRGVQREAIGRVTEHMEVIGSDGAHVGTVDKVRGDTLILTKSDPSAGGVHHAVPCGWIERVDDKVALNLTAEEATERWRTESRSRALFERVDGGEDGPHILNRSFSGTYRDDE